MKNSISGKIISLLFLLVANLGFSQDLKLEKYRWTTIEASGEMTGRHENGFVEYKGKFYLLGGRGINPVDVYDPKTNTWTSKSKSPMEIHHFQAVVYHDAIYLVGAMTGSYPKETPLENIWLYYPETDKWRKGPEIPKDRRRGGAGAVVYNDMIYMACGIDYGHTNGTNNYFDSFDLKTGEWNILTKAPHIRDHFPAIVVNDKLYCVGGRNTSVHYPDNFGAFFNATIPNVDVYDFTKSEWVTLKNELPVPTAAGSLVQAGNNLIFIGGEGKQTQAYNLAQCLDLETGEWSQLAPLNTGRHGTGAVLYKGDVYIAAGSPVKGGGALTSIEVFSPNHNWTTLFNGKNLDGWEIKTIAKDADKKNYWTVEDGAILCNSMGDSKHSHIWLQSVEEYDNFELRLKFQSCRENKGNAGVQVRSRYDDQAKIESEGDNLGWMDGPQVDIDTNDPWRCGLIYDETREVRHWINPVLPDWKIDKEKHAPKKVIHYYEDEEPGWNDLTIICDGVNIKTFLNNILVSDYDGTGVLDDAAHHRQNVGLNGHIALQLHMNSENKLRFKDIEIRKLNQK